MKFVYVDITSGVTPLRAFLKIRDTSAVHAPVREKHTIGIPTLVIDDEVYLVSPEQTEQLIEQYGLKNTAE